MHWGLMASSRESAPMDLGSFLKIKQLLRDYKCPPHWGSGHLNSSDHHVQAEVCPLSGL